MNHKLLKLFVITLFAIAPISAQYQELTLEKIYGEGHFASASVTGFNFMKDNNYYSKIVNYQIVSNNSYFKIVKMDIRTNKEIATILDTKDFDNSGKYKYKHLTFSDYVFSNDEKRVLLFFNGENIYRHSTKYIVYMYDLSTKKYTLINDDKILHATLNNQGDKIVFVKDNNLYYYNINNQNTVMITNDGKWNHIINGNCDWVYEEEFSFTRAFEIAPDGNSVAFYRFDESKVPEYVMTVYDSLYPTPHSFKYPKAGEVNSEIKILHYDFNTANTSVAIDGTGKDIYIPRIRWASHNSLCIFELNRHQNNLKYHLYDKSNKNLTTFLEEKNPYYIEISDQFHFTQDGKKFLYLSEQDGWNRVYLYDLNTKTQNALTPPSEDVNELLGYDEALNKLYYTSCGNTPYNQHLYQYDIKSRKTQKITNNEGWNIVTASSGLQYFLINESTFNSVPKYKLINSSGKIIQLLEQNKKLEERLSKFKWGNIQPMTLSSADNKYQLHGYFILPPNFDNTKKYPVLMYQYSGPGSQEVKNRFPLSGHYYWHQYLAHQGYIIACFDGRGTGSRGQEFKKVTYLQLGKYESDDQIALATQIGNLPYVDKSRIGIWGWSYGGFMAATCLLKGNDVFKTAIAVAPVTNWRYYDNIYTERYMRTPKENPKGYDDNAPDKMAKGLKGNLLIIHGTSDDNVHFQNAVQLTDALIKENKEFESFYYPNKDHSIRGKVTRWQLYKKMSKYIINNL